MPTIIEQPGEGPFDDPASGQHGKTGALFSDDVQVDFVRLFQGGYPCFEDVASIAAIDPQLFQAFDAGSNVGAQQVHHAVSVGGIGRSNRHPDDEPESVDQGMPLAPVDLFSRIVSLFLALGCRLDTLTIYAAGRRMGVAALAAALLLCQRLHQLLPDPRATPGVEVAIHRFLVTKTEWQHRPLTAGLGQIEDAIDHAASRTGWATRATSPPLTWGQQGLEYLPLRVGQIRRIFSPRTVLIGCLSL
jgi:hypothetical protein